MNLLPLPRHAELTELMAVNRLTSERIEPSIRAQGYELHISESGAELAGADQAGLFYGRATLRQLAQIHGGMLPTGWVRDHPDIPVRAVMLDISRDRVPTMETLYGMVDRLASWKINQIQLYTEHTFAYRDHPAVHAAASPLTAEEIRALDGYCAERFIELVPNQNCLGHMERWLRHGAYRALALAPDGFVNPSGRRCPPMTINPTKPESLALIRGLLKELLPLYASRRVHLGLDETWELSRDRIADLVRWVTKLGETPELQGYELLMWADMIADDPNLLKALPPGVTVCEWGYEASHPFGQRTAALKAAGASFWVSPGTSSWLSLVGRASNARQNCCAAAEAAIANGATGYLITDWGDQGHHQQLAISEPALAYGAAVSWCLETNRDIDLVAALSSHSFSDESGNLARALLILGNAYLIVTPQLSNMSALALHFYYPQVIIGKGLTAGLRIDELERLERLLGEVRERLSHASPKRVDGVAVIEELYWSVDVMDLLAADAKARLIGDGSISSVPASVRRDFAARVDEITVQYRRLWLARSRPGGLQDSVAWLDNLHASYATGEPREGWGGMVGETWEA